MIDVNDMGNVTFLIMQIYLLKRLNALNMNFWKILFLGADNTYRKVENFGLIKAKFKARPKEKKNFQERVGLEEAKKEKKSRKEIRNKDSRFFEDRVLISTDTTRSFCLVRKGCF